MPAEVHGALPQQKNNYIHRVNPCSPWHGLLHSAKVNLLCKEPENVPLELKRGDPTSLHKERENRLVAFQTCFPRLHGGLSEEIQGRRLPFCIYPEAGPFGQVCMGRFLFPGASFLVLPSFLQHRMKGFKLLPASYSCLWKFHHLQLFFCMEGAPLRRAGSR